MSIDELPENPMPAWVKILIVVLALPVLAFPWLLSLCPEDSSAETFLWLYPAYVLLSAWLEWKIWPGRAALAYVLMGLMVLTHGAMILLVDPSILLP